ERPQRLEEALGSSHGYLLVERARFAGEIVVGREVDHRRDAIAVAVPDALEPQSETVLLGQVDAHAFRHRRWAMRAARAIEADHAVSVSKAADGRRTNQTTAAGYQHDVLHIGSPPWPAATHMTLTRGPAAYRVQGI